MEGERALRPSDSGMPEAWALMADRASSPWQHWLPARSAPQTQIQHWLPSDGDANVSHLVHILPV